MFRPSTTRAALILLTLAGCGGAVPETTLVQETDPVALSDQTLPSAEGILASPEPPLAALSDAALVPTAAEDAGLSAVRDPAPSELEGVLITVRAGENLVGIAGVAGISVEDLVQANGIDARHALQPGQQLRVPLSEDLAHAFAEARDFARADRLDRYMAGRGGLVGVESHAVRTGETAWGIAREQAGVPVWVLSAFNPDTGLDSLGIGQRVKVPVFADSVASVDEAASEDETGVAPMPTSVSPPTAPLAVE